MKWLTADLPGTGGEYKQTPTDFQVEEIPLYSCCGSGEHLYLWIEKEDISTRGIVSQLQQELRLKEAEIGYAGLKDAKALTRQMISVPLSCKSRLSRLELYKAKILDVQQHSNKLRLGHLSGNRFTITLRQVAAGAAQRAEAILQILADKGIPNLFGEQRYGILGNSAQLGLLLLQRDSLAFCREFMGDPAQIRNADWRSAAQAFRNGHLQEALAQLPRRMSDEQKLLQALLRGKSAEQAVMGLPKSLLRLFLSAAQSHFFDQLLLARLPELNRLRPGDIAVKHANGACFRVTDCAAEQPRCDCFEISPTAPLFGSKIMLAEEQTGTEEQTVLQESGLQLDSWKIGAGLTMQGERRALRVPISDIRLDGAQRDSLTISFALPKGSYATSVLREVTKMP